MFFHFSTFSMGFRHAGNLATATRIFIILLPTVCALEHPAAADVPAWVRQRTDAGRQTVQDETSSSLPGFTQGVSA
jgi:hypothetical protein